MIYRLAVVDDNETSRLIVYETLSKNPNFVIDLYETPAELLLRHKEYDLLICDWDYGHVKLDYFIDSMDRSKVVVLTGSDFLVGFNCKAVLRKSHTEIRLMDIVLSLLSDFTLA